MGWFFQCLLNVQCRKSCINSFHWNPNRALVACSPYQCFRSRKKIVFRSGEGNNIDCPVAWFKRLRICHPYGLVSLFQSYVNTNFYGFPMDNSYCSLRTYYMSIAECMKTYLQAYGFFFGLDMLNIYNHESGEELWWYKSYHTFLPLKDNNSNK